MSTILRVLVHCPSDHPLLLVRCDHCRRVYRTKQSKSAIENASRCAGCKKSGFGKAARRWSRNSRVPRYWSRKRAIPAAQVGT